MALEYIDEVVQNNYTITGVTDESYPAWNFATVYPKGTKVIYNYKIYEAYTIIPLPTYYVYNIEADDIYIPSSASYVATTTFNAANEFENKFIYIDDTDMLYKYIGTTPITQHPSTINFANTSSWTNLGKQLNGYLTSINYPDVSPLYWKDLGYINSKRAFDNSNPSQTVADGDTLVYVFSTSRVDRIALFNINASKITIKTHLTTQPEDPTNTIETVYELYKRTGASFYEILTSEITVNKTAYFSIPSAATQEITLTLEVPSGIVAIGDVTLGKANTIGVVLDGLTNDIQDYSTYSSDTGASDSYTEGGYRKTNSFTVSFPSSEMDAIQEQLEGRRGKITVYNLNPNSSESFLRIKGFIRSRPIDYISNSKKSKISIKIEGRVE